MKKNLLLLLFIFSISIHADSQAWSSLGGLGFDGDVNATCVYNGTLYAAGNFKHDALLTSSLTRIAKLNGSNWIALGSGLDSNALAMVVFNNDLYVGGNFLNAGGTPANRIARWNGTSWSAVGSGFNSTVRCLYVWNNELYAGGTFTGRIAKLSGTTWQTVGGGASGPVNAIIDFNNELYIGGIWTTPNVSKLSGGSWTALTGTGPDGEVTSLAVFKKQTPSNVVLWIGGKFNSPSPRLCTWTSANGFANSFNPFSASGGNVNTLFGTGLFLYAGGGFSVTVGSSTISKIARYNGAAPWDSVGVAFDDDVNSLTTYTGHLVAGGKFTTLGTVGADALRIAIRNLLIGVEEPEKNILVKEFFPNPLTDRSILKLQTKLSIREPELKIFDVNGREVNTVTGVLSFSKFSHDIEYRIERSGLPAGIYFYRLNDEGNLLTVGKFVIE